MMVLKYIDCQKLIIILSQVIEVHIPMKSQHKAIRRLHNLVYELYTFERYTNADISKIFKRTLYQLVQIYDLEMFPLLKFFN